MNCLDKDLLALQEARDLAAKAQVAAGELAKLTPEQAWHIAEQVAKAAAEKAGYYAEWAVRETGMGNAADKTAKNTIACTGLIEHYRGTCLGGLRTDPARNLVEVGRPAGVVLALVASTSPIATLYFKTLINLMSRNAVILSPHPIAAECAADACAYLHDVAVAAGAPQNAIQIQRQLSLPATKQLMADERVKLILATGGAPMVRAAYQSGRPALGVGAGNVPVIIDEGIDTQVVAQTILRSKNFDHGTPCNAESTLIPLPGVAEQLGKALRQHGGHLCTPKETKLLRDYAYPKGQFNPAIVGKSSAWIAAQAGFKVADNTAALIVHIDTVCAKQEPFCKEKLSPILGFFVAQDRDQAITIAQQLLAVAGQGHTAVVHSHDQVFATQVGIALDVNRIVVNMASIESSGISENTGLDPTFTIGTGFGSGSSIAENVGPQHLVQWKRIAFDTKGAIQVKGDQQVPAHMSEQIKAQVKALVQEQLGGQGL